MIKAKIKPGKIEIAENEEMTNVRKIKNYGDKVKLKKGEETLAVAEWDEKENKALLTHAGEQTWISGPDFTIGVVAFALKEYSPIMRLAFMNELIQKKL